ncbi:uncharacterized protein LTR77_000946 [Saxophila tyrrhenica]|uniref:Phosphatidylinositol N-acetylglucosaminyltransferase subunit H conserved domain-containing protein n=1 Tax=Saxophila tyrrhenica TaxID=1690608 RepID=A0AAV9PPX5_9PEZI|nr:hypothetical protein LTR77_000946 [Saxophila tyrrhenica]
MLNIKRPTSTTVLYTFSTRAPQETFTALIANYSFLLARIAAGFLVAILCLIVYRTSWPVSDDTIPVPWLEEFILSSPLGQFATLLIISLPQICRFLLCAATTWLIFRKGYTEESLLVIRGLGVQTSTSSPSYLWTSSTRFIPTSSIQDIFIHEAFKGFEVRYYLTIVVDGENDVVVVFPNILPRREILENVWRGARSCLYGLKS